MKRLMAHVVAGNPDLATTRQLIRQMVDRQIAAIEIQIPFSDPIADGPVLMAANDHAVQNGISVDETIRLIQKGQTKCYIMSYLQPILHYGPQKFFAKAFAAGCAGFIIPDLPFDAPETKTFVAELPDLRHTLVPVLSPGMSEDRLNALFKTLEPNLIYLTARQGITGEHTLLTKDLEKTIKQIRRHSKAPLAVGFGIQTSADVQAVLKLADLAVVGSVLTKALSQSVDVALDVLDELAGID